MANRAGVNDKNALAFGAAYGEPLGWCRVFAQTQTWSTGGPWANAIAADARGEGVALSFKLGVPMLSAAGGSQDSRIRGIANGLVAAGITDGVIAVEHEPENPTKGINAAEWVAMQKHVLPLLKSILGPSGWRTAICLMGYTANPASHRNVDAYRVDEADVVAWDPYNNRGESDNIGDYYAEPGKPDIDPDVLFGVCIDVGLRWGKPSTIFEVGCPREQMDVSGTKRTAWWKRVADQNSLEGFEFVCHFDMGPVDSKADYAIRAEAASLAEFKRAIKASDNPCAALEAQVVGLQVQVVSLTAERAELVSTNAALTAEVAALTADRDALDAQNQKLQKRIDDAVSVLTVE